MDVKPWEWMVKPTLQKEWIQGRGMLSWLSFFFVALGAGMYFVSFFLNYPWAMFTGWLICLVLGGGTKFLDLGKPARFWRMLINYTGEGGLKECLLLAVKKPWKFSQMLYKSEWRSSWISRGMYFIGLFAIIGAIHLGLYKWAGAGTARPAGIVMAIVSFLVTVYAGLLIGYVKAIPLWGSALMPALFVVSGFLGGAALALAGRMDATTMQWVQVLVFCYAGVVVIYLWNTWNGAAAGKYSVSQMLRGPMSPIFYGGVVVIGILVPVAAIISSLAMGVGAVPVALLAVAIACVLIGDLSMRYLIMKCGTYTPLLPVSPY